LEKKKEEDVGLLLRREVRNWWRKALGVKKGLRLRTRRGDIVPNSRQLHRQLLKGVPRTERTAGNKGKAA